MRSPEDIMEAAKAYAEAEGAPVVTKEHIQAVETILAAYEKTAPPEPEKTWLMMNRRDARKAGLRGARYRQPSNLHRAASDPTPTFKRCERLARLAGTEGSTE